ncbi:MAG: hypothetical protein ACXV1K_01045 [Kineosporiaceae bacterium]
MASRRNSTSPKPIDTGNPHASPLLIHLAQEHQVELRRAAEAYRRRLPSGSAHADVPSRRAWHRSRQRLGALLTPSDCLENPMILSSAFLQVLTAPMITEVTGPVDGGPAGPPAPPRPPTSDGSVPAAPGGHATAAFVIGSWPLVACLAALGVLVVTALAATALNGIRSLRHATSVVPPALDPGLDPQPAAGAVPVEVFDLGEGAGYRRRPLTRSGPV